MPVLRRWLRRLHFLFFRGRAEAEMAEELRFHLEQRAADLAADGLPEHEAQRAAQRRFGHLGRIQEEARDVRGWGAAERAWKDLRFAVRQLARSPGFTILAVLTLGLGIGANTSMFSLLNSVMLKPLPFADLPLLDRLYRVTAQDRHGHFAPADVRDFLATQEIYSAVTAYDVSNVSLSAPGEVPEMVVNARISANLLRMLGHPPRLGRDFRTEEEIVGRHRVVILSDRVWRNRFDRRADVIGRTVRLDGEPHEIVGVMSPEFNDWRYFGEIDLFRPLALTPEQWASRERGTLRILGRRAPDRPTQEVDSAVAAFAERLARAYPATHAATTWRRLDLQATTVAENGHVILPMLIGLSGFVLLIACSNLANLLLARTMTRAREFAVRAALGASRAQLLRPLAFESLLLALLGAGLAVLVAMWFRDWAAVRSTGDNGEQVYFALDWNVLAWACGAALVTAVAFGLAPALFALRLNLNETLKSGGRGVMGGRGHQRFRQALIVMQFALAMVLLAGAALFVRGLHDVTYRRAGWESDHLVTGTVLLPESRYGQPDQINALHRLALERLAALPGVDTVSVSSQTPFFGWADTRRIVIEGQTPPEPGREPAVIVNAVSPDYFRTFGTALSAGRAFTPRDDAGAPPVFILSESAARAFFGDADPLGRRLAFVVSGEPRWGEVVGVARDVRPAVADARPVTLQLYQPFAQEPRRQNEIAVRARGVSATVLAAGIREVFAGLDPDLPVRRLQEADARIERANYQLRVLRDILAAMGLLGLGLATLGIYGVIARTMAQRHGEFAIRLVLGATVRHLTRIVLAAGAKQAIAGAAIGVLGALAVARVLQSSFPGMDASGAPVLVGTAALLVGVALLACWLPARRAGRVDAMSALRAD